MGAKTEYILIVVYLQVLEKRCLQRFHTLKIQLDVFSMQLTPLYYLFGKHRQSRRKWHEKPGEITQIEMVPCKS